MTNLSKSAECEKSGVDTCIRKLNSGCTGFVAMTTPGINTSIGNRSPTKFEYKYTIPDWTFPDDNNVDKSK